MSEPDDIHKIAVKKAKSRGISINGCGGYVRHVLFCGGNSCCSRENYDSVWKYINKRLREIEKSGIYIYRTRVECLSFCRTGPLLVVYPDGIWYHTVTEEVFEQIAVQHLIGGEVVKEYAFADNPMNTQTFSEENK